MIYAVLYDDEIRIWWDVREDKVGKMLYRVIVDGKACILTNNCFYDFKNLEKGREYEFEVQVVDEKRKIIGKVEKCRYSTLIKREIVDVTKPPYNAVGDGVTDNTAAIQRAFDDCEQGKQLYFPMGIYICGAVKYSGNLNVRFDAGAIICNKAKEKKL